MNERIAKHGTKTKKKKVSVIRIKAFMIENENDNEEYRIFDGISIALNTKETSKLTLGSTGNVYSLGKCDTKGLMTLYDR